MKKIKISTITFLTIVFLLFFLVNSNKTTTANDFTFVNNTNVNLHVSTHQPTLKIEGRDLTEISIMPVKVNAYNALKTNSFILVSDYMVNIKTKKLSENVIKNLSSDKSIRSYVEANSQRSGNFWDSSYSIEIQLTQYFDCAYNVYDPHNRNLVDLIHYHHRIIKVLYLDPQVVAKEADYYYPSSGDKYRKDSYDNFTWVGREFYSGTPNILGSANYLHQGQSYYFYNPSALYWNFRYESPFSYVVSKTDITLRRGSHEWKVYFETVATGGIIYLDSGDYNL